MKNPKTMYLRKLQGFSGSVNKGLTKIWLNKVANW